MAQVASPETATARVTVNLPWKVWQVVLDIAGQDGITRTEALRRCISTEAWRRNVVGKEGGQILVRKPDGSFERVVWPY
jgi:hypothetical protein